MNKYNLIWGKAKRQIKLEKHGLDFSDAVEVLENYYRYNIDSYRGEEHRVQSFAYVMNELKVLTVVHTPRNNLTRIISFRKASTVERLQYYE